MRFNIGDKVRHRGLKWLWGTVEEIFEASSPHSDDGRYYLYKVSLKQGNHYIDRGCEWERIPAEEGDSEESSGRGVDSEGSMPSGVDSTH